MSWVIDLAWRTAFRFLYPIARIWWHIARPSHQGALVAIHVGPSLLMVRQSYRTAWSLPGGGVRQGETPEQAAHRELHEELGVTAPALEPAGIICGTWEGRRDRVHFFQWRPGHLPAVHPDNREITTARLLSPAELRTEPVTGPVAAYLVALRLRAAA